MKTYMAKPGEVEAKWHLVDASDQVLGLLAVRVATVLMGKHRPEYTPHVDTGEFVIVVNADKVRLTGNKWNAKAYQRYSGYPGGQKAVTLAKVFADRPTAVVTEAVRRMLPKNKLGRHMLKKLKVYAGSDHPHQAQQPEAMDV